MSNREPILDEELEKVTGGEITYTWNGTIGTIGIDGYNPFILLDKNAYIEYYNSVKGTGIKEAQVLTNLLKAGIIKKP